MQQSGQEGSAECSTIREKQNRMRVYKIIEQRNGSRECERISVDFHLFSFPLSGRITFAVG